MDIDMRKQINRISSWMRLALMGGALVAAGTSLAFTRLSETKATPQAAMLRLVVDESPARREGQFVTSFAPVMKQVAPSVVNVFTTTTIQQPRGLHPGTPLDDQWLRRFFGDEFFGESRRSQRAPRQSGLGSGVIVTEDGYILTNHHVVDKADEIRVALNDGREFRAKIVGTDPKSEIAVLKIDASDLAPLPLADSDKVEIGDIVLAVGNPFGIGQTVTMGIVSATGRASLGLDYEDFIQTDAAINPGNSGGALLDAYGRLIGINTAILSRTGGNHGIGFAVPSNLARSVMENLVSHGRVIRGFMGVGIQDLTPALARQFKVPEAAGAVVTEVHRKSPAERAGLKIEDVIIELNGKPVKDSRSLRLQVAQIPPETRVPVKILRGGKEQLLHVVLRELPRDIASFRNQPAEPESNVTLEGVRVGDINASVRQQLGLPANLSGAVVLEVEESSAAYRDGLRAGDVILEMNRQPVRDAEQAVALSEKSMEKVTLLRVWSRGGSRYLVVDESKGG
jgi:serine protease Do